jgi:hypothetical protein
LISNLSAPGLHLKLKPQQQNIYFGEINISATSLSSKVSTMNSSIYEMIAANQAMKDEIAFLKSFTNVKGPKVPCPGITGKNVVCKKYCMDGEKACKVHSRPLKEKVIKVLKVKVPKQKCTGLNMRNNPCKKKCVEGETWCEKHNPDLPRKEKKTKKKKIAPEHNHKIGCEPLVPCELCQTHGDMFDINVDKVVWRSEAEFWFLRTDARQM